MSIMSYYWSWNVLLIHQNMRYICIIRHFLMVFCLSTSSSVHVNSKPINGSASEHINSETVLYASVKKRDKTWASEQQNIQMKDFFLDNPYSVFRSVGFSLHPECSEKLTSHGTSPPELVQSNFWSVLKWEFMYCMSMLTQILLCLVMVLKVLETQINYI